MQRTDWDSLLRVIAARANLEEVKLHDAYWPERRNTGLVRAFLQAVQQNNSVRSMELRWVRLLTADISTFVNTASSITSFRLICCDMEPADREQGARDLAAALQRNTKLHKRNLTSLCLHGCSFAGGQVHEAILSFLSRMDSPLRCFEFLSFGSLETALPGVQFENLLQAIQKSKLERFKIGRIESMQQMRTLTQSIASMKLKELVIECIRAVLRDMMKEELIQAVKNSFTLLSVKCELFRIDHFDNEDKTRLAFYANRNTCLDQWVDNPETVKQRKVWPEALNLAQRAGPGSLFRGLRSVLESDYVKLPGGRKRKRPQHYAP